MPRLLVINPNSNSEVTHNIDRALSEFRVQNQLTIDVINLEGTPLGIESQQDVDSVVTPMVEHIKAVEASYDGFVLACFSDPGLFSAREVTAKPVIGIAQAGLLTALTLGQSIGVISILPTSIPRHWRYYRALGISETIAGDVPLGAAVAELADESKMTNRMIAAGRTLRENYGADVLVLGCAGMPHYRQVLENELSCTVIDPTQAAIAAANTAVTLGYTTR
jgi:allantoin racemase